MRTIASCLLSLASLLLASMAHADCTRPRPGFQIPEGASATEQELLSAKQAIVKFDDEVGKYLRCLEGDASQKAVGKDAKGRDKVRADFVTAYNAAADELSGLG